VETGGGGDMTLEAPLPSAKPTAAPGWTPLELMIWRSKWLIGAGILACLIVAGVVTVSAPPLYRARVTIDPGDLREEEKDIGRLAARAGGEVKTSGHIEVATTDPAPEAAAAQAMKAVQLVLPPLERLMEAQREKEAATRQLANELRTRTARLRAVADTLESRIRTPLEAAAFASLITQLTQNSSRLIELDTQVRQLAARQSGPRALGPPSVEKVSIRRRLAVNLAIGFVVGLAVSLAFAFVLQHLQSGGRGWRTTDARY
jgi:Chain length determinant protein